jgi:hypothetical protein
MQSSLIPILVLTKRFTLAASSVWEYSLTVNDLKTYAATEATKNNP